MQLIPLIYLKEGRAIQLEQSTSPFFDEDLLAMIKKLKAAGVETVFIIDLNIPATGVSPHLPLLKEIVSHGVNVIVGGNIKTIQTMTAYIETGMKYLVFGSIAYQHPKLIQEACETFGEKIAAHIDVKANRVVVPGWTVAANKTALDYAERFRDYGMKTLFYSDVSTAETMLPENFENILAFCKAARMRTYITSEITGASDIETLVKLGAPGLQGLVLTKAFYKDMIDIKASLSLISDLLIDASNDETVMEE